VLSLFVDRVCAEALPIGDPGLLPRPFRERQKRTQYRNNDSPLSLCPAVENLPQTEVRRLPRNSDGSKLTQTANALPQNAGEIVYEASPLEITRKVKRP
jgi:hypothetical protein